MTAPRTPLQRVVFLAGTVVTAAGAVLQHLASPPSIRLQGEQPPTHHQVRTATVRADLDCLCKRLGQPVGSPHRVGCARRPSDPPPVHQSLHLRAPSSLAGVTPAPGVTLAVVGINVAARALRDHYPERNRPDGPIVKCSCEGLKLGEGWSEHAARAVFDALPTVQGRTDAPLRRSGLEDVDPELVELLRTAGDRWGPLGVALVASTLTDPNVLVAYLRRGAPGPVQPIYARDDAGEKGTSAPDVVAMADELTAKRDPGPTTSSGWLNVHAGQLTEFVGRTIVLPDREDLPQGELVMTSARFERLQDGDGQPDVVLVALEGLPEPYAVLVADMVRVRNR